MTGLFIYGVATITLWLIATVAFPDEHLECFAPAMVYPIAAIAVAAASWLGYLP